MRTPLKRISVVGSVAGATFLSGFTALIGARAGGLEEGGWNFQLLPPLFCGWLGGFLLSLIGLAFIRSSEARHSRFVTATFVAPLLITFCGSAVAYSAVRSAGFRPLVARMRAHPEALRALIAKTRVSSLSEAEHTALKQMVLVPRAIHREDIPILLDYFAKDGPALKAIMNIQTITPDQLRYLHERHKNSTGYDDVLDGLASHPLTPLEVLHSLTEETNPFLVAQVRERLSKTK